MRIRSIRPEFWTSDDIAALPWDYRLIFIGLWSYVDDNGVGRDVEKLILADLFPLDPDQQGALRKIHGALTEYSSRGLITRYTVESKPYLHVTTFSTHQVINRPSRGRYPLPTCGNAEAHGALSEPSVSPQVNEVIGEGEKGRRGEGEKTSSSEVADATSRPEITKILDHLDAALRANGSKIPGRTKRNIDAARLLLDRDHRTLDQVLACIDFATTDEFWRVNVLSMSKLREKYDQLRQAASRKRPGKSSAAKSLHPSDQWMYR